MVRLAFATLAILATNTLLCVAFIGVGLALWRAIGLRKLEVDDFLLAFWVGLAVTVLACMVVHFFWPISDTVLLAVLLTGSASLWLSRTELKPLLRDLFVSRNWPWTAAFALLALWLSNLALAPLVNSDSAGYHLPAIIWMETYPIVPGLANLFGPLGFNNVSFLYGALLSAGPWNGQAHHLVNSVLVLVAFAHGLVALRRIVQCAGFPAREDVFQLVMLVPAIVLLQPDSLPSYSTDVPVTLVMLVVVPLLYRNLSSEMRASRRELHFVSISILLALAVCIKIHVAVFAASVWPVVAWKYICEQRRLDLRWRRTFATALLFVSSFAGLWLARGAVLSGYPLFPLPQISIPFDWRVPQEHAQAEHAFIVHSTRVTASLLGVDPDVEKLQRWVPEWLRTDGTRHPYEMSLPLLLALVAVIRPRRMRRNRAEKPGSDGGLHLLIVLLCIGMGVWFVTAPAPRYAMYLFWALTGLVWTPTLAGLFAKRGHRRRLAVGICCVFVLSPAVVWPALQGIRSDENPFKRIVQMNINRPPSGSWMPTLHEPRIWTFATDQGFELKVPVEAEAGRCWASPIPCTPNPAPNLMLRDPADIRRGFRVNGEWRMNDWPYPRYRDLGFLEAWRALRGKDISGAR